MFYELLLLVAIFFVAGWVFLLIGQLLPPHISRPLFQVYLLTTSAAYFVYCWTHGGQTLPMKTWRIRVVTREGHRPLRPATALLRFVCAALLLPLSLFWVSVDRDRQFLHDRLAGTLLIPA